MFLVVLVVLVADSLWWRGIMEEAGLVGGRDREGRGRMRRLCIWIGCRRLGRGGSIGEVNHGWVEMEEEGKKEEGGQGSDEKHDGEKG